jgi:hypothetical protein
MKLRAASLLLALAATLTPLAANATSDVAKASPTGKGMVGGALLGAEVVMVTETAFKVKPVWAYILGGVAGAAGGGVGGYFLEHGSTDARPSMLLLAGGMAFAIPTTVAVLSATNYEPPASFLQDQPPVDEPIAEPPAPENMPPPGTTPAPAAPAPAPDAAPPAAPPADGAAPAPAPTGSRAAPTRHRVVRRWVRTPERLSLKLPPPALFGLTDARLALGIPNIQLLHSYTRTERLVFGAPDVTELHIPVLDVTF